MILSYKIQPANLVLIDHKVLGTGSFGKVFLASNKQDPDVKVAIKVIQKTGLSPKEIKDIREEVAIL